MLRAWWREYRVASGVGNSLRVVAMYVFVSATQDPALQQVQPAPSHARSPDPVDISVVHLVMLAPAPRLRAAPRCGSRVNVGSARQQSLAQKTHTQG